MYHSCNANKSAGWKGMTFEVWVVGLCTVASPAQRRPCMAPLALSFSG